MNRPPDKFFFGSVAPWAGGRLAVKASSWQRSGSDKTALESYPKDKTEVRLGIFAPEGDFWSDPIKFPGFVVPAITKEMLNEVINR